LGLDNLPDGVTTGRPAIACWSAFTQGRSNRSNNVRWGAPT